MVADLDKHPEGGNIILKYDMSKAYDRVEWRFYLRAMRAMGFSIAIQDLVYRSIFNIRYRVCINSFYSSEFQSTRGVRQRYPFSPLLFIIAQQILRLVQLKNIIWGNCGHICSDGMLHRSLIYSTPMICLYLEMVVFGLYNVYERC